MLDTIFACKNKLGLASCALALSLCAFGTNSAYADEFSDFEKKFDEFSAQSEYEFRQFKHHNNDFHNNSFNRHHNRDFDDYDDFNNVNDFKYNRIARKVQQPSRLLNYTQAKKELLKIYYRLQRDPSVRQISTLYCGCPITVRTKSNQAPLIYSWSKPDLQNCGYQVRSNRNRANKVEIDLVMPAWEFDNTFDCFDDDFDRCDLDNEAQYMSGDLHNLFPAVGELKADRRGYQFVDYLDQANYTYGHCQMRISSKDDLAAPPERSRGMIARAYLYMANAYGISLSQDQLEQYIKWDRLYQPTRLECERNKLIAKVQGNTNPFIDRRRCSFAR